MATASTPSRHSALKLSDPTFACPPRTAVDRLLGSSFASDSSDTSGSIAVAQVLLDDSALTCELVCTVASEQPPLSFAAAEREGSAAQRDSCRPVACSADESLVGRPPARCVRQPPCARALHEAGAASARAEHPGPSTFPGDSACVSTSHAAATPAPPVDLAACCVEVACRGVALADAACPSARCSPISNAPAGGSAPSAATAASCVERVLLPVATSPDRGAFSGASTPAGLEATLASVGDAFRVVGRSAQGSPRAAVSDSDALPECLSCDGAAPCGVSKDADMSAAAWGAQNDGNPWLPLVQWLTLWWSTDAQTALPPGASAPAPSPHDAASDLHERSAFLSAAKQLRLDAESSGQRPAERPHVGEPDLTPAGAVSPSSESPRASCVSESSPTDLVHSVAAEEGGTPSATPSHAAQAAGDPRNALGQAAARRPFRGDLPPAASAPLVGGRQQLQPWYADGAVRAPPQPHSRSMPRRLLYQRVRTPHAGPVPLSAVPLVAPPSSPAYDAPAFELLRSPSLHVADGSNVPDADSSDRHSLYSAAADAADASRRTAAEPDRASAASAANSDVADAGSTAPGSEAGLPAPHPPAPARSVRGFSPSLARFRRHAARPSLSSDDATAPPDAVAASAGDRAGVSRDWQADGEAAEPRRSSHWMKRVSRRLRRLAGAVRSRWLRASWAAHLRSLDGLSGDELRARLSEVSRDFTPADYELLLRLDTFEVTASRRLEALLLALPRGRCRELLGRAAGADLTCAVCLEHVGGGDSVVSLPCSHAFHGACIDCWLRAKGLKSTCPLCNQAVFAAFV